MKKKTEMDKLEGYLMRHGMRYDRMTEDDGERIFAYGDGGWIKWIAHYDPRSMGGLAGLLAVSEVMDKGMSGYLTAKDVIERLEARG
ncbi:MAG: hypothetical protein LUE27_11450 [Clostridia bacterium]|nr:hypothetical protein [Clostridia bacterium]